MSQLFADPSNPVRDDHANIVASGVNWNKTESVRRWLEQEIERGERRDHAVNQLMLRNWHWFNGRQNIRVNAIDHVTYNAKMSPSRDRVTVNFIGPRVRRRAATYMGTDPTPYVIPATDQEDDAIVGRYGTGVCQYYRRRSRLDHKLRQAFMWADVTGVCYWKVTWNPKAGPERVLQAEDHPDDKEPSETSGVLAALAKLLDPGTQTGAGSPEEDTTLSLGDIEVDLLSRFEIIHPPGPMESWQWVIHRAKINKQRAIDTWGKKKIDMISSTSANKLSSSGDQLRDLYQGYLEPVMGSTSPKETARANEDDTIVVYEVTTVPFGKFTKGRQAVFAAGLSEPLVAPRDNPDPAAGLPIVEFITREGLGSEEGASVVTEAIAAQGIINRTSSYAIDNVQTSALARLQTNRAARVDFVDLGERKPGIVEWSGIVPPGWIQTDPLPQGMVRDLQQYNIQVIDHIMDIEQPSQGRAPGSVRGTGGVQSLLARAEVPTTDTIGIMNESLGRAYQKILQLFAVRAREERQIQIRGENNEFEVAVVRGSDLLPESRHRIGVNLFDVVVLPAAGMPESPSTQIQKIQILGAIPGALEKVGISRILRWLGVGATQSDIDPQAAARAAARREIEFLKAGKPVIARRTQDHAEHISQLRKWAGTSLEYERSVRQNPDLEGQIDNLLRQHLTMLVLDQMEPQLIAAAMLQPQQQAQAAQGQPQGQRTQ